MRKLIETCRTAVAAMGVWLALAPLQAHAADLCIDGLCVVRAQVSSSNGTMTRYQPVFLTVENRTGKAKAVVSFRTDAADSVQVLRGDDWDVPASRVLVIAPNEYRTLGASTQWRVMLVGLKSELRTGGVIYLDMKMKSGRSLQVPVTVVP
jgi:copper(I)-binding protein